jgi:glucose-6-phosphate isomerase, archaeal
MKVVPINDLPVSVQLNVPDGSFEPCIETDIRKVSTLAMMFLDQKAVEAEIKAGDPVVYQIRYYPFLTSKSDMALGTTMILPGKVGNEYYMTKGHFHQADNQPEIYHCVQGEGVLQMMTLEGEYIAAPWKKDTITHIPPHYAHRVVNTGSIPLVFVASFHLAAGHIYGPIEKKGFKYIIVEKDGQPTEILNPKWA